MRKNHKNNRRGITAIEAMVAAVLLIIIMVAVSGVLAQCQRNWNAMYRRVYSDVVIDSYFANIMFESVIRKSSFNGVQVGTDHKWVEVNYYADDTSTELDRYARFYYADNRLYVEHGRLNPKSTLYTIIACSNVTACSFRQNGKAVHMLMTINNGSQQITVGSSAKMHN